MKKVLVSFSANSVASREFLTGVFSYVNADHAWNLQLGPEPYSLTPEYLASTVRDGLDGIITGMNRVTDGYKALIKIDLPIALNNFPPELPPRRPNIAVLHNDETAIGRAAAKMLRSKGQFRSYGFVPNPERSYWSVFRERGFRLELARWRQIPHTFRHGKMELGEWLKSLPKPIAVFAAFDLLAARVIEACKGKRLCVPEQVAVVGVDNDEVICNAIRPTLSSVRPDHVELARRAAAELDKMMHGKRTSPPRPIFIPPLGVIERDSTRAVPPAGFLIREGLAYINENAVKGIGVKDVARHLRISESLARLRFRTIHGRSIKDMILDARLAEIKRQLEKTSDTLVQIAAKTGFSSACRLSHFFKTRCGIAPQTWRITHI
ncbi:MAG: substrate-binding domain-containing protein [Kiritimatiellae bacterium]|nr:substrate-binding domain-containing protein [Kiritimatiellia bacterium]